MVAHHSKDTITTYVDGQSGENWSEKPADPKHDGLEFTGWTEITDEAGNTIYVATYKRIVDPVEPVDPITKYVDGQSGKEWGSKPEKDPSYPGLKFTGWKLIKDDKGNLIYVATYEPDPAIKEVPYEVIKYVPTTTDITKKATPDTGDHSVSDAALVAILAGGCALVVAGILRRRNNK